MSKQKKLIIDKKVIDRNLKRNERLIFHDFKYLEKNNQVIFSLIIITGVIFVWRGLWNMVDVYWFPSYSLFSNITGIIFGMVLLYFSHKLISQLAG